MYEKYDMERGKMSQNNQERVQQIWVEIDQWEKQKESGVSLSTQTQIDSDIASAKVEIERLEAEDQAAEKELREQKTQTSIDTYVDIVQSMFDALLPAEIYASKIGLTEYGEIRSQYYQLNHAYFAEAMQNKDVEHEEVITQKDEKIRLLNKQSLSVLEQLDVARRKAEEEFKENDQLRTIHDEQQDKISDLEAENADLKEANSHVQDQRDEYMRSDAEKMNEMATLQNQIDELEKRLTAAQKPRDPAPSQSLSSLMDDIKSKNAAKLKSNAELAAEGSLGFRGKVELPSAEIQQESPFQISSSAEFTSDQVLVAESTVEVPQFQTVPAPALRSSEVSGDAVDGIVPAQEEFVTRSELRIILDQQKKEIVAEIMGDVA